MLNVLIKNFLFWCL